MSKKKRQTFECWNCGKTYKLYPALRGEQKWTVACPYCNLRAVVQLEPFRKPKPIDIYKGAEAGEAPEVEELVFPDIIPTEPEE